MVTCLLKLFMCVCLQNRNGLDEIDDMKIDGSILMAGYFSKIDDSVDSGLLKLDPKIIQTDGANRLS